MIPIAGIGGPILFIGRLFDGDPVAIAFLVVFVVIAAFFVIRELRRKDDGDKVD